MNRHAALLSFAVALLFQSLFASAKTDSIVTFLGGANAKFVWQRWAWCNEDYTPKTQAAAATEGRSLMLLDTRTGTERTLVTGLTKCHTIRISRSGKWVTYIEGTTTYIIDLTSASPVINVLMAKSDMAKFDCSYWAVNAMWVDPANGDEYLYCLDNAKYPSSTSGNGIYKVRLTANGTADRSTATKLTINSSSSVDESFSVSADGKKLGGAFPWPNTYILDIPTGRLDSRHYWDESFGCQANIAPDNSYRFYHCQGDHQGVYMFDANMVNTVWFLNLSINLAGVPNPNNALAMDFEAPRWTNHLQYYSAVCPMGDNNEGYCTGMGCYMEDTVHCGANPPPGCKPRLTCSKCPNFS